MFSISALLSTLRLRFIFPSLLDEQLFAFSLQEVLFIWKTHNALKLSIL